MSASTDRIFPGVLVLFVFGGVARILGDLTGLNPLVIAIVLGVALATTVGVPAWAESGVNRYKLLLETGIVLLGASLAIDQLVSTGPTVALLAIGVIVFGIVTVELLGRLLGADADTRPLLAAGGSICGVSAVLAVGQAIESDESAITYAAATVLLFDAITIVVFPIVGALLGVPDRLFGVWAGLSLFSTGPAAAVGFAMSDTAGQWATVTKLIRNSFIGVLAVAYAIHYTTDTNSTDVTRIWSRFPKFLIGFVIVAVLANTGVLSEAGRASVSTVGDWLFTLAFVGLGIELNPREFRSAGVRPIVVIFLQFVAVTTLAYLAVMTIL